MIPDGAARSCLTGGSMEYTRMLSAGIDIGTSTSSVIISSLTVGGIFRGSVCGYREEGGHLSKPGLPDASDRQSHDRRGCTGQDHRTGIPQGRYPAGTGGDRRRDHYRRVCKERECGCHSGADEPVRGGLRGLYGRTGSGVCHCGKRKRGLAVLGGERGGHCEPGYWRRNHECGTVRRRGRVFPGMCGYRRTPGDTGSLREDHLYEPQRQEDRRILESSPEGRRDRRRRGVRKALRRHV